MRTPLMALGIFTAQDLCVLDPNPPPLSFKNDLNLPPHPQIITYKTPDLDRGTYWQTTGPHL